MQVSDSLRKGLGVVGWCMTVGRVIHAVSLAGKESAQELVTLLLKRMADYHALNLSPNRAH